MNVTPSDLESHVSYRAAIALGIAAGGVYRLRAMVANDTQLSRQEVLTGLGVGIVAALLGRDGGRSIAREPRQAHHQQ